MKTILISGLMIALSFGSYAQVRKPNLGVSKDASVVNQTYSNSNEEIKNSLLRTTMAQYVEIAKPYYRTGMTFEQFLASTNAKNDGATADELKLLNEIFSNLQKKIPAKVILQTAKVDPISILVSTPTFPNPDANRANCRFICKLRLTFEKLGELICLWDPSCEG